MKIRSARLKSIVAIGALLVTTAATSAIAGRAGQDQPPRPGPMGRGGPGGPGGRGGPGGPGGPGAGLIPRVPGLTDAQRQQFDAVAKKYQSRIQPMMDELRTLRDALETAVTAGTFDEATIRQKSSEVGAAETELAVLQAQILNVEILPLLTSEQKTLLQQQRDWMQRRPPVPPPGMTR